MAENCRFAFAVHILSVLALKADEGVTSEALARSVNTNPVVIRRIVSALQRAGLLVTWKGSHGGAKLVRPPRSISLGEIYRAIEPAPQLAQRRKQPNPGCPVGKRIVAVLDEVFASAQAALEAALTRRTLADVLETMSAESPRPARSKMVRPAKAA